MIPRVNLSAPEFQYYRIMEALAWILAVRLVVMYGEFWIVVAAVVICLLFGLLRWFLEAISSNRAMKDALQEEST